jgi:hypothetical protein
MFQVLDRQGFEEIAGEIVPIGSPVPPPPQEAGWKDTVQVGPDEIVRVIARFENYVGLYPYHCHILEHEDHEMMRQFQAVATTPACQDGIDNDGDGLIDFAGNDPGCDSPEDLGEHAPTLPCDDGIDNDGDGLPDFPEDPGCAWSGGSTESPQCNDGVDNDGDGGIDSDGTPPDVECGDVPYHLDETVPAPEPGMLVMLAAGVALLAALSRRRRRLQIARLQ